jgi:hypothetical protein
VGRTAKLRGPPRDSLEGDWDGDHSIYFPANNKEFAGACFSRDDRARFLSIVGAATDAGRLRG